VKVRGPLRAGAPARGAEEHQFNDFEGVLADVKSVGWRN